MLIESGYANNPSDFTTKNGVVVFGGVVARYTSSLSQLGFVKFCGHCFYNVSRYVSGNFSQSLSSHASVYKSNPSYEFLIASLPMTTHLAVVIRYAAANHNVGGTNSPKIDLIVKDGSTVIDAGIRFEFPTHLSQEGFRGRSRVFETHTGVDIQTPSSGSYTVITSPRPLFIPVSNRGNILTIVGDVADCNILAIDVFEVYQEVRIP